MIGSHYVKAVRITDKKVRSQVVKKVNFLHLQNKTRE